MRDMITSSGVGDKACGDILDRLQLEAVRRNVQQYCKLIYASLLHVSCLLMTCVVFDR